MKKFRAIIGCIICILVIIFFGIFIITDSTEDEPQPIIRSRDWDGDDGRLLAQLAATLAGDQDEETKMLVMLVALNRVWTNPGNIEDHVHAMLREFGILELADPDDECWGAEYRVQIDGWDESRGALYICRNDDANALEIYDSKYEWLYDSGIYSFYK